MLEHVRAMLAMEQPLEAIEEEIEEEAPDLAETAETREEGDEQEQRPEPETRRVHDRRGWRSRAPWRHADCVRARRSRRECGGARCTGAPCIRVAYGEGMGRSRSGPASIQSAVSPAPPPAKSAGV